MAFVDEYWNRIKAYLYWIFTWGCIN